MENGLCGLILDSLGAKQNMITSKTVDSFLNQVQREFIMSESFDDSFVPVSHEEDPFILLWMDLCESQRPEAEVINVTSN